MTKLQYVYSLIGSQLILKKYKIDLNYIMSNKNDISKKTLFKDIKKGLQHLKSIAIISVDEYKLILSTIKQTIKSSNSFSEAVQPFLFAVISSKKGDTSAD